MDATSAVVGAWADGNRYEAYVGRWSRPVARQFVAGLAVPPGRRWLDHAEGMQLMRRCWDAAARVDPTGVALDEGVRFPICAPGPLHAAFTAGGLVDVVTGSVEVPTVFADFDDYWDPFLGGTGHAPAHVATLDEPTRGALREELRRGLPVAGDGSIALTARAWTVRARVPG